jgi:hypothetical protein
MKQGLNTDLCRQQTFMSFKVTFNKKQLTHFVLDRFFEQAEWKKNYKKTTSSAFGRPMMMAKRF